MLTKAAVLFVTGTHGTRGQSLVITVLGLTFHLPLWVLELGGLAGFCGKSLYPPKLLPNKELRVGSAVQ